MRRRTVWIFILWVGIRSGIAWAEGGDPLTLLQVRKLALENSSKVIGAMQEVENSKLDKESALSAFYPSLSLQGSVGFPYPSFKEGPSSTDPTASYAITLNQQLYSGGSRLASLRQAALSITKAKINEASIRTTVLQAAETLFFDVLEKQDAREVALKELRAAERSLEVARGRYEVGAVDKVVYLQAQSKYKAKQAALYQAEYAERTSKNKLQLALGLSNLGTLHLPASLVPEDLFSLNTEPTTLLGSLVPFIEKLKTYAREHNPDLKAVEMSIQIQDLSVQIKEAAFFPTLSLGWSHTFSGPLKDTGSITDTGKVTVSATIPILPYQDKKAAVGKAENTKVTLSSQLQEQIRTVESSVVEYVQGIVVALQRIEAAQASVEFGEENYRQVYERYSLSKATLMEVSDAESTLSDARAQLLSARYALYRYWLQLKYLLGFEEDESFVTFLRQTK
ncbi:MAG: TolC family protein [Spirochaetes bacterium]|nr:TolC family protein [Spirochaetota bacterium]